MPSEKLKMLAGELYRPGDAEIQADQAANKAWLVRYNAALGASAAERRVLLREHFAAVGEDAVIRPPFFCDFGYNIRLGTGVFLNFNCVILDVVAVSIGDGTQIGRNVWIGGGAIILPGVRVGDDAVIGAGSVVTRDVAVGATVMGSPARPVRG